LAEATTLETLMEHADAEMYEEKKARARARLEQGALGSVRRRAST